MLDLPKMIIKMILDCAFLTQNCTQPLGLYSGRDKYKGLGLIDRVPEELWKEVCDIVQEAVIKTIPKKEMQDGKMVF